MLSRVADSLYWMSRYVERMEHTSRLLYVHLDAVTEQSEAQVNRSWRRLLGSLYLPVPPAADFSTFDVAERLTHGSDNQSSILVCIQRARDNARQVRERISSDMWEQLNRTYLYLRAVELRTAWGGAPGDFYMRIINDLHLFNGVTDSSMRQDEGWHFMRLGRFVERAQILGRLLELHFGPMPNGVPRDLAECDPLEWFALLRSCAAFEAYCKVHSANVTPQVVADFLVFDPLFPRSLRFAVTHIADQLAKLGGATDEKRSGRLLRLAGLLKAKLDYGQVDEIIGAAAVPYLAEVQQSCERIHQALYETFIDYGVDAVVAA